jgi:hypothetical protein
MLTGLFSRLGGAARLPFSDFLMFNLSFDFAFDLFGMARYVQSGLSKSVQRHAWPGRDPGHDASLGYVSAARRFGKLDEDVEDAAAPPSSMMKSRRFN